MAIIHQQALVIVRSNICNQMHVQVRKTSLAYLQCLIFTLDGVFTYYFMPAKVEIKFCRYAREYFTYLYMHLAT